MGKFSCVDWRKHYNEQHEPQSCVQSAQGEVNNGKSARDWPYSSRSFYGSTSVSLRALIDRFAPIHDAGKRNRTLYCTREIQIALRETLIRVVLEKTGNEDTAFALGIETAYNYSTQCTVLYLYATPSCWASRKIAVRIQTLSRMMIPRIYILTPMSLLSVLRNNSDFLSQCIQRIASSDRVDYWRKRPRSVFPGALECLGDK